MKKFLLLITILTISFGLRAQNVGINTTGGVPNASAALDIDFTNKGLLVPRVALTATNAAAPITAPATSLLVYNTATVAGANAVSPGFYYWDGTIWQRLASGGVDTDDQTLSINEDSLFIADGNFVLLPNKVITLDSAYDAGGRGVGRVITADSGAVLIQGNDGFQITGTNGSGEVLVLNGSGTRMFFYPRKSAFRTGFASGAEWDDDSIGNFSNAMGSNVKAKGFYSTAIGFNQNVTGTAATALGVGHDVTGHVATALGGGNVSDGLWTTATGVSTLASGQKAFSMGEQTKALGGWSLAGGRQNDATGEYSVSFGRSNNSIADYSQTNGLGLLSPSFFEFVSGRYNDTGISNSGLTWVGTERLFTIGNGGSNATRNNAFVVYKDGNAYLNGSITLSDGTDSITFPNTDGISGQILQTDGNGTLTWVNAADSSQLWHTLGNTGTNAATNFVGTTDNQALTFRVNDTIKMRLETNGTVSILNTGLSVFVGENAGLNDDLTVNRNTFIGNDAGRSNTSGFYNAAVGEASLRQNTTANYNTAMGAKSLYFNTTGTQNNALGFEALYRNTTGNNNAAVGVQSMYLNTSGNANAAVGVRSLYRNTTGGVNVAFGYLTMEDNTTGNYNSAIGAAALANNTTGNANTALGYESLQRSTTGINNTMVGYQSAYFNSTGDHNTGVGLRALYTNTTGNQNTAVGYNAIGTIDTGSYNTALGSYAMWRHDTGDYNTSIGYNTLVSILEGNNNVVVGASAGDNLVRGSHNLIIGGGSDAPLANGSDQMNIGNIIYGENIDGTGNTVSTGNIGIGVATPSAKLDVDGDARVRTLPNGNTTDQIVTADVNGNLRKVSFDSVAGGGNPSWELTGNAGTNPATNFVGTSDNQDLVFRTNNAEEMRIDAGGDVGINNTVPAHILDVEDAKSATTGATVRIANKTGGGLSYQNGPAMLIEIPNISYGERNVSALFFNRMREKTEWSVGTEGGTTGSPPAYPASSADTRFFISRNAKAATADSAHERVRPIWSNNTYFVIQDDGTVGLGLTSPTYKLTLPNNTANISGRGIAFAWNTYSDGRLKDNRTALPYGINTIMQLNPLAYDHHNSAFIPANTDRPNASIQISDSSSKQIGFIAQELVHIVPEAVSQPANEDEELWSVDYTKLIPVLVKATQEQQQVIDSLKNKVASQDSIINQANQQNISDYGLGNANNQLVEIQFSPSFQKNSKSIPVVTVTPMGGGQLLEIVSITKTGFKVKCSNPSAASKFTWIAMSK